MQAENAQSLSTGSQRVLKRLGRTLEQRRRACLVDCDGDAGGLRSVHLFEIHQVAGGIDDRHGHRPVVLARFRQRRRGGLLRRLEGDGQAVGNEHLRQGDQREHSPEEK